MSPPSPLLRWLLPLLIVIVTVVLVAALMGSRPQPEPQPLEERAWPVAVQTAELGDYRPIVRLQGFLESPALVTVVAPVEADVLAVPRLEGERVGAGELLIRLDEDDLRLVLAEREAELAELRQQRRIEEQRLRSDRGELALEQQLLTLTRREAQRLRELAGEQFVSPSALERAELETTRQELAVSARRFAVDTGQARLDQLDARMARAEALRDRAALNLARTRLQAPFDGRLAEVMVAAGDRVRPGEPLVRLYDSERLEIRVTIPRVYLSRIRDAQQTEALRARVHIDGQVFPASLSRFAGRAERGQGGVDALFRLQDAGEDPVLGRFAELELGLPVETGTVLLPFEALYDTARVYRVENGRLRALDVERLGDARFPDGRRGVLVRSDALADGDRIVTTQLAQAMDGLRVQVLEN
ncbi:MAG: efflux RND transporter periplasmic adaptor subunit [Ectothiorhodospiraceae bacterium]|nr:efflux RND transporter periplasmic adaptor subunit [Ectothiorhodospiraceae bacterium]